MYGANESGDAVFMVQPEEIGCYKSLRRVVDSVFTTPIRFLTSSVVYADMDFAEEGVNRQLRSMLFVPSKRKRRGMPRPGTSDKQPIANTEGLSAVKQTQRQSKQKERCENRLLSLLFATIYDPATRRCRLVHDVPPLKLCKTDRNGQVRTVSNYTEVRLYLRNSMSSILSAHSEAVKTLNQLLPDHYGVLPSLFTIIARAFMVIVRVNGSGESSRDSSIMRVRANEALDYCMNSIQNFITTWERRNFSTDNPLLRCLEAGINNEHYKSVRTLLHAMIHILPPTGSEPYDKQYRGRQIHAYGLPSGIRCDTASGHGCLLGEKCPSKASLATRNFDRTHYSRYITAFSECVRLLPVINFNMLDDSIDDYGFSTASWRCSKGLCVLHRMETCASLIRKHRSHRGKTREHNLTSYWEGMHWDIAGFWSAVGRSNFQSWHILDQLKISDTLILKETAVELIFGGAMASIALFERVEDILPICAKLRSKKGPMVVRRGEDISDGDGYEVFSGGVVSPKQHDGKDTRNATESAHRAVNEDNFLLTNSMTSKSTEGVTAQPGSSQERFVAIHRVGPEHVPTDIVTGNPTLAKQVVVRDNRSESGRDITHIKENNSIEHRQNNDRKFMQPHHSGAPIPKNKRKSVSRMDQCNARKRSFVKKTIGIVHAKQQTENSDVSLPSQKRRRMRENGA